jgi:KUP system potassium uptake protein
MSRTLQAVALTRRDAPPLPAAAALAALGIVYGDIGTSPLYALRQAAVAGGMLSSETVLGIVSLILWTLILVVSLKYAILIMRADNNGEGGIIALLALLDVRRAPPKSWRASLLIVGLIGAALLYGDGVITPAISVLSAIEGLKLDAPRLAPLVVPVSLAILIGLFLVQRKGTAFIANIFGPVMLLWFLAIGVLGLGAIARTPAILGAIGPHYALAFLIQAPLGIAFAVLGAVFLAVTGGEAMYADMGQFGCLPIRLGWFGVVLPGLLLNYFGQGALLLSDPRAIENPFYLLAPRWAHYPMVAFATAATIIASQAIISGAYSLTEQAIQLGFLPRMRVLHTASQMKGQIYITDCQLALGSRHARSGRHVRILRRARRRLRYRCLYADGGNHGASRARCAALGLQPAPRSRRQRTVSRRRPDICRRQRHKAIGRRLVPAPALAGIVAFLMLTWRTGYLLLEQQRSRMRQREDDFVGWVLDNPPIRLPGAAAIFSAASSGIPLALTHHLRHNRVLHERVLLINIVSSDAPRINPDERVRLVPVGAGITRVILQFGFMEHPNVMDGLKLACHNAGLHDIDPQEITYYFRRVMVIPSGKVPGMAVWRERLFAAMHLNANLPAAYFGVPTARSSRSVSRSRSNPLISLTRGRAT